MIHRFLGLGFLFYLLLCGLPGTSKAQVEFSIGTIRKMTSRDLIAVNKVWRKDLPERLAVGLHVAEDTPGTAVTVSAYFYDQDYKLVASYTKPNEIWTGTSRGIEAVRIPEKLPRGKTSNVYFALPEDLSAKQWKSVLIIFSNGTQTAKRTMPEDALSHVKGPESPAEKVSRMDSL